MVGALQLGPGGFEFIGHPIDFRVYLLFFAATWNTICAADKVKVPESLYLIVRII